MNQKTTEEKMTAGNKTAIDELAEIMLEDDEEELRNDYMGFVAQTNELIEKSMKLGPNRDAEYWNLNKRIMWNQYAMAVIEEKMWKIIGY